MSDERLDYLHELDPDELTDVSEIYKQKMKEIGYKPYRTASGGVKWTSPAGRLYRLSKKNKSWKLLRRSGNAPKPNQIKSDYVKPILGLIKDNILFMMLVAAIALGIMAVIKYNLFF